MDNPPVLKDLDRVSRPDAELFTNIDWDNKLPFAQYLGFLHRTSVQLLKKLYNPSFPLSRDRGGFAAELWAEGPSALAANYCYSTAPNRLISSSTSLGRSFGTSPRAAFSVCTILRMVSTTSGLASVVTSPTSMKLETAAMTRRMIFPERVLGMSGTSQTFRGRAILPMILSIASFTFSSTPLPGL